MITSVTREDAALPDSISDVCTESRDYNCSPFEVSGLTLLTVWAQQADLLVPS